MNTIGTHTYYKFSSQEDLEEKLKICEEHGFPLTYKENNPAFLGIFKPIRETGLYHSVGKHHSWEEILNWLKWEIKIQAKIQAKILCNCPMSVLMTSGCKNPLHE